MMKTRCLNKLLVYLWCICGEVIRILLKYCIYCARRRHPYNRESTDSLIPEVSTVVRPLSGLFSDSSALCDVRVRTRYSILVRIL